MTIREKIEAVLRKHGIIPGLEITKFGASSISDDLLSCFPQPSWASDKQSNNQEQPAWTQPTLCPNCGKNPPTYCFTCWEKLPAPSLKTLERIFELHDHKYSSRTEWLKAIQFDILRWENGNWSEPKVWCEDWLR